MPFTGPERRQTHRGISGKMCNCTNREECPLDGKCLTECIVYKVTVTQTESNSNNKETYIGLTENTFKTRYNLHKSSFKLKHKKISYRIKRKYLGIKNNNIDHRIEWEIIKKKKK